MKRPKNLMNFDAAADILAHYHVGHTEDMITRLVAKDADILIVSDPIWRDRLKRFVEEAFPCQDPFVKTLYQMRAGIDGWIEAAEVGHLNRESLARTMRPWLEELLRFLPTPSPQEEEAKVQ